MKKAANGVVNVVNGVDKKAGVKVPYNEKSSGVEGAMSKPSSSSRRASRDALGRSRRRSGSVEEGKHLLNGEGGGGLVVEETRSRLARGDKYVVRGKRQDTRGNVQYLIEWGENGVAA